MKDLSRFVKPKKKTEEPKKEASSPCYGEERSGDFVDYGEKPIEKEPLDPGEYCTSPRGLAPCIKPNLGCAYRVQGSQDCGMVKCVVDYQYNKLEFCDHAVETNQNVDMVVWCYLKESLVMRASCADCKDIRPTKSNAEPTLSNYCKNECPSRIKTTDSNAECLRKHKEQKCPCERMYEA